MLALSLEKPQTSLFMDFVFFLNLVFVYTVVFSVHLDLIRLNQRPMGHIAHLQFKSINTYDYIITMIKKRKKTHY